MARKLTPAQIRRREADIVARIDAGETQASIAKEYGIGQQHVSTIYYQALTKYVAPGKIDEHRNALTASYLKSISRLEDAMIDSNGDELARLEGQLTKVRSELAKIWGVYAPERKTLEIIPAEVLRELLDARRQEVAQLEEHRISLPAVVEARRVG